MESIEYVISAIMIVMIGIFVFSLSILMTGEQGREQEYCEDHGSTYIKTSHINHCSVVYCETRNGTSETTFCGQSTSTIYIPMYYGGYR